MMLVWSGWGLLVIPIVVVTSAVVGGSLVSAFGLLGIPQFAFLAVSVGIVAAAAANWFVGRRLNGGPGRELIDAGTGERVVLRRQHRLFWIKMEYWSVPVLLAALVPLLALGKFLRN